MNNILVVVDMQNDFITGPLGTKEAQAIVPYIEERIRAARSNGDQIIFTRDTHESNYLQTREGLNLPVEHCIRNTSGWQIIDELISLFNIQDDVILDKPSFGSYDLGDEIHYRNCLEEITEITLVGVCTGICVLANAVMLKALLPEVLITVDLNGVACVTPETNAIAIAALKLQQINIKE